MSAGLRAAVVLTAVCTSWLWVPLVLLILFWVTAIALVFGKSFTKHVAALLVPPIMAMIDHRFEIVRQELLKGLTGRVLDVGAGGGAYFKYGKRCENCVTEYISIEPNRALQGALRREVDRCQPCTFPYRLHASGLEAVRGEQFDRIILGNVLCEVDDPYSFLKTIDALLKPGGRVFYSEHVLEDGGWKRALQKFCAPWWALVSDGCHCDRPTLQTIHEACPQWRLLNTTFKGASFIPLISRFEVGIAKKPAAPDNGVSSSSTMDATPIHLPTGPPFSTDTNFDLATHGSAG
eukprot:CAMPEP_0205912586 /NCGR_PEP_ID=MMETSP1325-20131115/5939_1 /ASSEMBLY_ACC=CAM_ASM_000708 /TAXON_ID=236786 /ORGANISM="Florenciella sp., Strain RCC1007" /LENGTH=291 /DNA_ID=CAMNT_0053279309 /DNA_START=150 /DNA_END=1026 /DNA_ORIENTATION=-